MLLAGLVLVACCGFVAVAYHRRWAWTGFANSAGQRKTLWDWLSLLVVPAALALGVFALDSAQADRAREREVAQAERDRAIAEDRNRADVLRTYMTQMTDLMLKHGLAKRRKVGREWDRPVEVLATTLTASALAQLDGERKGEVLRFLSSSELIDATDGRLPRVSLAGADLRGVVARSQGLAAVDLSGADLRNADLRDTDLIAYAAVADIRANPVGPQFSGADLGGADFRGANISFADFGAADLSNADFSRTRIGGSSFEASCLANTRFADASIHNAAFGSSQGAGVDFSGADLEDVRFRAEKDYWNQGADDAALTDVVFTESRRVRTPLPRGWGPQGMPMAAARKKALCRNEDRASGGIVAPVAPDSE